MDGSGNDVMTSSAELVSYSSSVSRHRSIGSVHPVFMLSMLFLFYDTPMLLKDSEATCTHSGKKLKNPKSSTHQRPRKLTQRLKESKHTSLPPLLFAARLSLTLLTQVHGDSIVDTYNGSCSISATSLHSSTVERLCHTSVCNPDVRFGGVGCGWGFDEETGIRLPMNALTFYLLMWLT
jgi:hypothetical protein